jgi:hypothetical protein
MDAVHAIKTYLLQNLFNIVACRRVSRERSRTNRFLRQQSTHNIGGTDGNGVFYGGPCRGVIRRTIGSRIGSWKGAAIKTELESGSRELAIVRSRYQAATSKDTAGWKTLACALVIF